MYNADRPVNALGYVNLLGNTRNELNHEAKFATRYTYCGHSHIRDPPPTEATWRDFAALLERLANLHRLEWATDIPLPLVVLQTLQRCHPLVRLSLLQHRFREMLENKVSPDELALATSPLVHEITAYCVDWENTEDPSGAATLKMLRSLPNLKVLHWHLFPEKFGLRHNPRTIDTDFGPPETNGLGRSADAVWYGFEPALPDTGPAKLETLVFSGKAIVRPATIRTLKDSMDLTCLQNLDLGRVPHAEVLRSLTGVNIMPNLLQLGIHFVPADTEYETNDEQHRSDVLALEAFMESLPSLQHLEVTDLVDPEMQAAALKHHSARLRGLKLKTDRTKMGVSQSVARDIRSQCLVLEEVRVPIREKQAQDQMMIVEEFGQIPSLRFAEFDVGRSLNDGGSPARPIWKWLVAARANIAGARPLIGIKVNFYSCASVVVRSERDDAKAEDVRDLRLTEI